MSDSEDQEDRRTEGVRIIGAQEAAEAAARPDVVRRRTRREKRYGDRPDEPEPASDLPKITISTTETEGAADPGRFGAVPVVRPGDDPATRPEPRWAEDEGAEPSGFGHARLVGAASEEPSGPASVEDDRRHAVGWASDEADETRPWSAEELADAEASPGAADVVSPGERYEPVSDRDEEPAPARTDAPFEEPGEHEPEDAYGAGATAAEPEDLDDDSFVLPHWTEPPTGQVPKVVVGADAPDPDSLATYGSQPRWRDEGEREVVTDFDDLIDEGPRLGALASDEDSVEDDFFSDSRRVDEDDYYDDHDEYYDEEDDDDDLLGGPPARRGRRSGRDDGDGRAPTGDRDLVSAVGVGVGLLALGLLCFAIGAVPTTALATVIVAICAWEYYSAVRSAGYNPATLLGLASVVGVMVAAYTSGLAAYPVVLGLATMAGLVWYLWVAPGSGSAANLGLTLLGVVWIGVLGSFATLFLGLGRVVEDADPGITSNPGLGVLIAAVVATVSHDVGAYFIGRYLGRTPMSTASPNKTQEGLAGGVLVSLVVTVVVIGVVGVQPIGDSLSQTFVFALLCALAAPLGDLVESFVKRDLGIKDMGSVLPGHGGVLDRFDALLFVLPVAYFVTLLFDVWGAAA